MERVVGDWVGPTKKARHSLIVDNRNDMKYEMKM